MKIRRTFLFVFVLAALLLQACGPDAQAAIATGIAQTQQISALETAAAAGLPAAQQDQAAANEAPVVVAAAVEVTTVRDVNMRAGNSTAYGVMTVIPGNEKVTVTGVDADGSWYQIEYHGAVGWISAAFTNGDVPADMPVVTPSALANNSGGNDNGGGNNNGGNEFDWSGNWVFYLFDKTYNVNINQSQSGDFISGSFEEQFTSSETMSNVSFELGTNPLMFFSGSLSSNKQVATGTWNITTNNTSLTGTFQWQIKTGNPNQFIGNFDGSDAWCGSRAGASMPSPCFWP